MARSPSPDRPPDEPDPALPGQPRTTARWALARRVTDALVSRHPAAVRAVWVHGNLAHGAATGAVELTIVTAAAGTGPALATRRVGGAVVSLDVVPADGCLELALTISPGWPLAADRYVAGRPLHDPDGWYGRLRDAHLARLAGAREGEFTAVARTAWCDAFAARDHATGLAEWHDTDGAMLALGSARLATALVDGLLTRTYFRNAADAVSRTGTGGAGLTELAERLAVQADELARRGYPVDGGVDGGVDDLVG